MNELGDLYFMSVLKLTLVNFTPFSVPPLLLTLLGEERESLKSLFKPLEYGCINPAHYSAKWN